MPTSPAARPPPPESTSVALQLFVVVSGAATVMAAGTVGNTSVTVTPVMGTALGFATVIVRTEVSPGAIEAGENDLVTTGDSTLMTALSVRPFMEAGPAVVTVLVHVPAVTPTTDT